MKKIPIIVGMLSCLSLISLSSCSSTNTTSIGILQIATHDALDLDRKGFIDALEDEGFINGENIKINIQNPEGDASKQISAAKSLIQTSNLAFGISTGSAQALRNAAIDSQFELPILFSASTDPVRANIVSSADYKEITGTSDSIDTKTNINLFTYFENIDKIACLYNTAEDNSQVQKNECEKASNELGFTFENCGVTSANQIRSAFNGLVSKGVDGVFIPTDNLIAENISLIKDLATENKIILVCADTLVVDKGGTLGYGIDYYKIGQQTGKMAAQILKGEKKASDIAWEKPSSFELAINEQFFKDSGIDIPEKIKELK